MENDAPEDIAKRVLMDGLVPEEEGMSVYGLVRQDANVAVKLGACIIGVLNVITEIADTAGSGTTMLLSISILMKYYDQLA